MTQSEFEKTAKSFLHTKSSRRKTEYTIIEKKKTGWKLDTMTNICPQHSTFDAQACHLKKIRILVFHSIFEWYALLLFSLLHMMGNKLRIKNKIAQQFQLDGEIRVKLTACNRNHSILLFAIRHQSICVCYLLLHLPNA